MLREADRRYVILRRPLGRNGASFSERLVRVTVSHDFLWRDDAIKLDAEDLFGRGPTADRLAKLIVNSHSWDSSVIFGLTGPWGSGKSSLINLATNRITTQQPAWRVVQFTPWATSDAAGLLEEFYRSIAQALPPAWGAKFRRTAGLLAQVAAPTGNLIPFVGGAMADAAKEAGAWLAAAPPWQAAFDRAARELREANTPILVIADDIDRLQTDELLLFLKVIRLLGRFPGVQYLIAYDERTLFRTLGAANLVKDTGSATRYMEKIVQYPVAVPPLLEHQLQSRVIEGIERVRKQAERPPLNGHNWNVLLTSLLPLTRTPRAIDRYLAQVAHDLPIVDPAEINDADLLLLIAFRQQFPTVAGQLPDWKERLVHGHTGEMVMDGAQWTHQPTDVQPLLHGLGETASETAHTLLRALFPHLEGDSIGRSSPTGGRHVTDLTYFDRYFSLGIPDNDIRDATVREAVEAARNGDLDALVGLQRPGSTQAVGPGTSFRLVVVAA